jgi:hypothetical protein
MTLTGNTLAVMNLLEESPGYFGFSWRSTGLEPTQRQAPPGCFGFIIIKVHRAAMNLIADSPGCCG